MIELQPLPFYNKFLVALITIVGITLAIIVYRNNPKEKLNKIFFLMVIYMLFWVNFAYLARLIGKSNVELAERFLRVAWFVTPLFVSYLYFLVIYLINKEKEYQLLNKIVIFLGVIASFMTGFTNLIVEGITFVENIHLRIIYGAGMFPFLGIIFFLICATLYPLIKTYLKSLPEVRRKIDYFLVGIFIFYVSNFIFNIAFPILFDIVRWYWIGDYSIIFVMGFTAYAIVARELFGIRVILTQTLVGVIALLLLIQTLLSETTFEYIWKGGLLGLFLIFGYLLINSVKLEIKRRGELEDLSLKLATTNIRLEAALKELEKLDKAKSEFISMASHQLRTPLSAIKGYISMMIEGSYGKVSGKMLKRLQNVYQSNERLIRLINDLLNISKIDLGKIELEKEPTQVEDLIQSCYEEMKIRAEEKGLRFVFKKPKMLLPKIEIDPLKIREVILNLIDNAIRYTQKGEITIKLQMVNGKLQISIKDTGEGLTKEEQKEIFTGFVRGSAGLSYFIEGAGLGLYVAKKFIELHGGKIWAESEGKDKGSTFYVELPIK